MISRFEILAGPNETGLSRLNIRGGLYTNYLQLWSSDVVSAWVNIFSEPNNMTFGWKTNNSEHLNT